MSQSPCQDLEAQVQGTKMPPVDETQPQITISTEASAKSQTQDVEKKNMRNSVECTDLEQGDFTAASSGSEETQEASSSSSSSSPLTPHGRFVVKVLAILTLQLLVSAALVGLTFVYGLPVRSFINNNPLIALVLLFVSIIVLLVLTCGRETAKKKPQNFILLALFTCSLSYLLAFLASFTESFVVLISLVLTFMIVLGSIFSALKFNQEFSKKSYFAYQSVPLTFTLLAIGVLFPSVIMSALVSTGVAALSSVHLMFDTQRLLGDYNNKYAEKDYILASLDIYADIFLIFVRILKLLKELLN